MLSITQSTKKRHKDSMKKSEIASQLNRWMGPLVNRMDWRG
jgi:hypothetical protein